jgi:hypothetical protein
MASMKVEQGGGAVMKEPISELRELIEKLRQSAFSAGVFHNQGYLPSEDIHTAEAKVAAAQLEAFFFKQGLNKP